MKAKLILLVSAFATLAIGTKLTEDEENKLFSDYLNEHHIKARRSSLIHQRDSFIRNYHKIEEHNEGFRNGTKSYSQVINKFSHLSNEEFFATQTGYVPGSFDDAPISPFNTSCHGRMTPPESWDWRQKPNVIEPVTTQGGCGSCTIFAVIGVMEAHMRIWYGVNTKLSEQEALPCCGGCGGGTNTNIYTYAKNGATSGTDFPYVGKVTESCNTDRPRVRGSKVESYYRIEKGANAATNGVWHLVNVGPIATGFCVPGSFGRYKSGVYDEENMSDCGWHAVMIMGYGTENGKPYWLVRNSYGPGWGENGYMKMARGKNLCRMEDDFTFPNMGW